MVCPCQSLLIPAQKNIKKNRTTRANKGSRHQSSQSTHRRIEMKEKFRFEIGCLSYETYSCPTGCITRMSLCLGRRWSNRSSGFHLRRWRIMRYGYSISLYSIVSFYSVSSKLLSIDMGIRDSYYPSVIAYLVVYDISVGLRLWVQSLKKATDYDEVSCCFLWLDSLSFASRSFRRYDTAFGLRWWKTGLTLRRQRWCPFLIILHMTGFLTYNIFAQPLKSPIYLRPAFRSSASGLFSSASQTAPTWEQSE